MYSFYPHFVAIVVVHSPDSQLDQLPFTGETSVYKTGAPITSLSPFLDTL